MAEALEPSDGEIPEQSELKVAPEDIAKLVFVVAGGVGSLVLVENFADDPIEAAADRNEELGRQIDEKEGELGGLKDEKATAEEAQALFAKYSGSDDAEVPQLAATIASIEAEIDSVTVAKAELGAEHNNWIQPAEAIGVPLGSFVLGVGAALIALKHVVPRVAATVRVWKNPDIINHSPEHASLAADGNGDQVAEDAPYDQDEPHAATDESETHPAATS